MAKFSQDKTPATGAVLLSARESRLLERLMSGNWLMRRDVDAVAGASNGPDIIFRLRNLGLEILMERVKMRDRDGRLCQPGRYKLAEGSQPLARELLRGA